MDDKALISADGFIHQREVRCGITQFVNAANQGFTGVLKARYTDFIVNEIMPDGTVVHLTDEQPPATKVAPDVNPMSAEKAENGDYKEKAEERNLGTGLDNLSALVDAQVKAEHPALFEAAPAWDTAANSTWQDMYHGKTRNHPRNKTAEIKVEKADENINQALKSQAASANSDMTQQLFTVSPSDEELLIQIFGGDFARDLIVFHEKILAKPDAKPGSFGTLTSKPFNRDERGKIHQTIREIFKSHLETAAIEEGRIEFHSNYRAPRAQNNRNQNDRRQTHRGQEQPRGKVGWAELGGEYLHFTLCKENKDTLEVVSYIAKALRIKPKDLDFAGTKDRRAVTSQRVSVFRQKANTLAKLELRQARIGNYTYEKQGLGLGDLKGNQFHITLRDCQFGDDSHLDDAARLELAEDVVSQATKHLQEHGFLNYFGLQRFGTFGVGTDEVGKLILREKYKEAVEAILQVSEATTKCIMDPRYLPEESKINRDDITRAHAIFDFKKGGRGAFDKIPRKFAAEVGIVRHLSGPRTSSDYLGALMNTPRNLRTMYVHAYQSLVWNVVASERWARYGNKVIKGDLILVVRKENVTDEVDENGEIIVRPAANDSAITADDLFDRARPLTLEEAESGDFSIYDVVLPTPGWDIEYPANDIGDYYKEFMGSERGGGLDPANMRRGPKDFSLSGSYRKLKARVGDDMTFDVWTYHDENTQLVETDLDRMAKKKEKSGNQSDQAAPSVHESSANPGTGGHENSRGGAHYNNVNRGDYNHRAGTWGSSRTNGRGTYNSNRAGAWGAHQGSNRGGFGGNRGGQAGQAGNRGGPTGSRGGWGSQNQYRGGANREDRLHAAQYEGTEVMNAWLNFPTNVGAHDRELREKREKAEAERLQQPIEPASVKDTWIQATVVDEGRVRTGVRQTLSLKDEGAAAQKDFGQSGEVSMRGGAGSSHITESSDSDGGVLLNLPHKRSADQISASSAQPTIPRSVPAEEDVKLEEPTATEQTRVAVVVKFKLDTSQYATMALRELMKAGGVQDFKPEFSGGR